jgi:hypothetical protein
VKPEIQKGEFQSQSSIAPYDANSINHLILQLFTFDGTENDLGISRDIASGSLGTTLTFSHLKANTTYRIKASAYKAAGIATSDLISPMPRTPIRMLPCPIMIARALFP